MLDIKFIRENPDLIKEAARKKHIDFDLEALLKIDKERSALLLDVEEMRARQGRRGEKISQVATSAERELLIGELKELKEELSVKEEKLKEILKKWQKLMIGVPNVPDISVPEGASDEENREIRTWGERRQFDFGPKSHIDLMLERDLLDLERGAKVAGFRGYFLKGDAVSLAFALWQFVAENLQAKGFKLMSAPALLNREAFLGTGYLPHGEEDLYKTQDDMYLAGTAEVPTMAYFGDELLAEKELPIKILAFSACFRREAGSHGKDTKGLMRVHEFFKLEQVVLCEASHEKSVSLHEEITQNSEEIMQALGLPYRVVANCGGDLGLGQVKKYDIEAWIPSEAKYRETHSASYFHDFQTRRMNIRYKDGDGKNRFAHSLNNTAIATPRILIALVENYQEADGRISVPQVLQKYLGKEKI